MGDGGERVADVLWLLDGGGGGENGGGGQGPRFVGTGAEAAAAGLRDSMSSSGYDRTTQIAGDQTSDFQLDWE